MTDIDWERVHATEMASRPDAKWLDIDLTGHDIYARGFPDDLFSHLREESPVWRHHTWPTRRSPDGVGFWVVLGHAEVQEVSRDWRRFSVGEGLSLTPGRSRTAEPHAHHIRSAGPYADPPAHQLRFHAADDRAARPSGGPTHHGDP